MEKGFARVREGGEEFSRQKRGGNRVAARYGNRIKKQAGSRSCPLVICDEKSTKFEAS